MTPFFRALLEIIAIRLATSRESVEEYARRSLFHHFNGLQETMRCVDSSLAELEKLKFIKFDPVESSYEATLLGKAIVASSIDPDDGLFIYGELKGALRAFVMDGDLHVLYTFTPINVTDTPVDWKVFTDMVESLDESGHRVMELLRLKVSTISRM